VKTCQGQLSLRAYRLSQAAMELLYVDVSPEAYVFTFSSCSHNCCRLKSHNLTFTSMFEELPIVVKNSHLISVLLAELKLLNIDKPKPMPLLEISAGYYLLSAY
jgi:translation initiation factor 3 subunit H